MAVISGAALSMRVHLQRQLRLNTLGQLITHSRSSNC